MPEDLAWYLRGAVTLGGGFATMAPWAVVPTARRILRRVAGHLVVDATPAKLGSALAKVGGAAPWSRSTCSATPSSAAPRATDGCRRPWSCSNDRTSTAWRSRCGSVVPQLAPWAPDRTVERAVDRLVPLFRAAAAPIALGRPAGTVTLQAGLHADQALTIAVFRALLDRDEFTGLQAGITLQAALPDTAAALDDLTTWAQERRARGGAPVTVRLVKGAELPAERVESVLRGWPLATWGPSARPTPRTSGCSTPP